MTGSAPALPRAVRRRRAAALLAGAVALELLVGLGPLAFAWTPLLIGLAYAAAAVSGGARGGYWPTAVVLLGFGLAAVVVAELQPPLAAAGVYVAGAGLGALAGALLARRGVAVDLLGVAATVLAVGLVFALAARVRLLGGAELYALALALVGGWNLVAPARG